MNSTADVEDRIQRAKETLGPSLVILGHHYQTDEVIQFADFRGDSLKLAFEATKRRQAQTIVFCGVHFMAETAAMLAQPDQTVLIPDPEAGCFLAEMAALEEVKQAWSRLDAFIPTDADVTPVTYVNSSAALKAFCGSREGIVCTSSNAQAVFSWALERRPRIFFFPDQHLGRNTANALGIPAEEVLLWDLDRDPDSEALDRARVILWPGWCNVHQRFLPEHVRAWREREPGIRVIVHPECREEVVNLADEAGSTATIVRRLEESPPGTKWAIGTEFNLVNRLRQEHPDQFVVSLRLGASDPPSPEPSFCRTMNLITVHNLDRVLQALLNGDLINPVTVPAEVADDARVALERMLEVS